MKQHVRDLRFMMLRELAEIYYKIDSGTISDVHLDLGAMKDEIFSWLDESVEDSYVKIATSLFEKGYRITHLDEKRWILNLSLGDTPLDQNLVFQTPAGERSQGKSGANEGTMVDFYQNAVLLEPSAATSEELKAIQKYSSDNPEPEQGISGGELIHLGMFALLRLSEGERAIAYLNAHPMLRPK